MTVTATFDNRRPFTGAVTSGSMERGILSAKGPRGGSVGFARNVHSGRWFMVIAGIPARSYTCNTIEIGE